MINLIISKWWSSHVIRLLPLRVWWLVIIIIIMMMVICHHTLSGSNLMTCDHWCLDIRWCDIISVITMWCHDIWNDVTSLWSQLWVMTFEMMSHDIISVITCDDIWNDATWHLMWHHSVITIVMSWHLKWCHIIVITDVMTSLQWSHVITPLAAVIWWHVITCHSKWQSRLPFWNWHHVNFKNVDNMSSDYCR